MKMIERVRLIEEIGAADGRRGVAKWVRGWRRLWWLQRAVDTMPALLHVVFDPIRYEELDYHAVAARVGIGVDEVEHRFACAVRYLHLVGRGEMSVADAQAAVEGGDGLDGVNPRLLLERGDRFGAGRRTACPSSPIAVHKPIAETE